jgi:hypothetical protein
MTHCFLERHDSANVKIMAVPAMPLVGGGDRGSRGLSYIVLGSGGVV